MTAIGWLTLCAYCWLGLFQLALAAGLPLGRLAWGGGHRVLPIRLRLASAASIPLAALGVAATGQALGLWTVVTDAAATVALWGLGGLFALSLVGNLITSSRVERRHGAPLAAILCIGSVLLAHAA